MSRVTFFGTTDGRPFMDAVVEAIETGVLHYGLEPKVKLRDHVVNALKKVETISNEVVTVTAESVQVNYTTGKRSTGDWEISGVVYYR